VKIERISLGVADNAPARFILRYELID